MGVIKESRSYPRVELFAQVQVTRDSDVYVMSTLNVSKGGVFISGNPFDYPDLEVGTMVELVIFSSEESIPDATLRGRVVRVVDAGKTPGFGLQFVSVRPEQASSLDRLIAFTQG